MKHVSTSLLSTRRLALAALLVGGSLAGRAQGVRIGTAGAPDASAVLDLVSGTRGALLPRVAATADVASPATGLIVYQTGGTAGYYYYTGTAWQQLATAAGAAITAGNGLTKSGQNVALGGTLGAATTIRQVGNAFSLTGGSVGIGTAAPQSTLEVSGDFRVSSGVVNATLGTTGAGNANVSGGALGQSFTMPVAGTVTSVRLVAGNNNFSTTFQIYAGSGNVGAAQLAAPQAISFTANTTTTVALATPVALAAGVYTLVINTGSNNLLYFNSGDPYAGGNIYQGTASLTPVDLDFTIAYSSGTPTSAFAVGPNGNVGIGTSGTPGQKLDVTGGSIRLNTAGQGIIFPDGSTQTVAGAPAAGSAAYIQNGTAPQASSSFNVDGSGTIGGAAAVAGLLTANGGATVTGATNLNVSGTAATNIGTGAASGTVTIGRTGGGNFIYGPSTLQGTLALNAGTSTATTAIGTGSGSGAVSIGRAGGTLAIASAVGIGTSGMPTSLLQVGGAVALPYTTTGSTSGTFTLTAAHHTVRRFGPCDNISIPQAGTCPGRVYVIISSNGAGSNVGLSVQNSGVVYDDVTNTTFTFLTPNQRLTIQSDGDNWLVIGR